MKKLSGEEATLQEATVEKISERLSSRKRKTHATFRGQPSLEKTLVQDWFKKANASADEEEKHGKVKVLVKDGVVLPQV